MRFVVFPLLKISDWDNEKVGAVHYKLDSQTFSCVYVMHVMIFVTHFKVSSQTFL